MPDQPSDLPAPGPDGCLDCKVPLYFRARTDALPAGFDCKQCGRKYRGAAEWKVAGPQTLGARGFSPPLADEQAAPDAPAPFALVPGWKWVGKKRRRR